MTSLWVTSFYVCVCLGWFFFLIEKKNQQLSVFLNRGTQTSFHFQVLITKPFPSVIPEHLVSASFYFQFIIDQIQLVAEFISVNRNLSSLYLWWSSGQAPGKALLGFLAYLKKEIHDEKDPVLDQTTLQDWWFCSAHPEPSAMFQMAWFKEA